MKEHSLSEQQVVERMCVTGEAYRVAWSELHPGDPVWHDGSKRWFRRLKGSVAVLAHTPDARSKELQVRVDRKPDVISLVPVQTWKERMR